MWILPVKALFNVVYGTVARRWLYSKQMRINRNICNFEKQWIRCNKKSEWSVSDDKDIEILDTTGRLANENKASGGNTKHHTKAPGAGNHPLEKSEHRLLMVEGGKNKQPNMTRRSIVASNTYDRFANRKGKMTTLTMTCTVHLLLTDCLSFELLLASGLYVLAVAVAGVWSGLH